MTSSRSLTTGDSDSRDIVKVSERLVVLSRPLSAPLDIWNWPGGCPGSRGSSGGGPPPDTALAVGVGRPPSRPKTGDRCEEELSEERCDREDAGAARGGVGGDGGVGR